jgi:2-methylisocitrate lyase-like PEP mutase family enzyme
MTTDPPTLPETLKAQLDSGRIVVAPGVYDGLGALAAARAGFSALYLSGASIAYGRFGRPDIGLVSMSEVADTVAAIRERVALPLVVDADTGYGNALNVQRTLRRFERAGASAIQLEDQTNPKRCGHLEGKTLVPVVEMVGKLQAALDARADAETLIVARTDAIAVEGFEAALERGARYVEAGCDVLFVEAPRSREELTAVGKAFGGRVALLANMVEGGKTPILPAEELRALGFSLVIFPSALVRAVARTAGELFETLARHGTTDAFRDRMFDFGQINELVGTPEMLETGRRYGGDKLDPPEG